METETEEETEMVTEEETLSPSCATIQVQGVPPTASAPDLLAFFSSAVGLQAVVADIPLRRRWLPHTSASGEATARVQFDEPRGAAAALDMFGKGALPPFRNNRSGSNQFKLSISNYDIVPRATSSTNRLEEAQLLLGNRLQEDTMEVLQSWNGVRVEIMPERNMIDIFLENNGRNYKLQVHFHDIISSCGCKLPAEAASDSAHAILLTV